MLRFLAHGLSAQRIKASSQLGGLQRYFATTSIMTKNLEQQISFLQDYSACDVSDALLKLQKPAPRKAAKAGFLGDIVPFAPASPFLASSSQPKVIAPATTMKLVDKGESLPDTLADINRIPKDSHWADVTEAGTVLVIEQPKHQTCASVGGIMASRMKVRGVAACVVSGRVRDLAELQKSQLPIWASGRSTVGQGAEAKVYARNIPLSINEVEVKPNDIVFCDPLEGVVVIPQDLVDQVIELMPKLVAADDKVKDNVEKGSSVYDAFKKHRG